MSDPANERAARILIVDDHEIFRVGLRGILQSWPGLEVCGEAVDGLDGVAKAKGLKPDLILMDISMPRASGLEAARILSKEMPAAKIIMLSQHDSPHVIAAAQQSGVRAFVNKSRVSEKLFGAIEDVLHDRPIQWNK